MKKAALYFSILAFAIIIATAFATDTIEQDAPFDLAYDHTDTYATRIYANGVLFREFSINEVRLVSSNGTNNTYAVTMPAFSSRWTVTFTATVFYLDGTNVVESVPSNALQIQFRPRKPGNLRRFQ
jgi:hypothetical protein